MLIDQYESDDHVVYIIESIPHEDASVVWGREVLHIRDDYILMRHEFYDQDGALIKHLDTLEVRELGGRPTASQQRMQKVDREGEWTQIDVKNAQYDIDLDKRLFTRANLRNPRE